MSEESHFLFSKARIQALPVPTGSRVYYHDTQAHGLTVCVTPTGAKTFYLYRRIHGRPTRIPLGRFPVMTVEAARKAVSVIVGQVAEGKDVLPRGRMPTFKEAFSRWLETYARMHRRRWAEDLRQFNKYLVEFHNRRLESIKTSDVARWHTETAQKHGPVQANRTLGLMRTVLNYARELGFTKPNPCATVRRFTEQSRSRFLRQEEVPAFFKAVMAEPDPWRDYFLMLLFSGQRRSDVAGMKWADVDMVNRLWRLRVGKSGETIVVPLSEPAARILARRYAERNGTDCEWVFPSPTGKGHVISPKHVWARVTKRAGLADLTMHDLRRTFASWQAASGSTLQVISASLGHKSTGVTGIYSRLTLDPVRDSMERAARAMLEAAHEGEKRESDGELTGALL